MQHDDVKDDILSFVPKLQTVLLDTMSQACEASDASLTAAQVKEILKLALLAVRQSRKACGDQGLTAVWNAAPWNNLSTKFAATSRFKSSTGLQSSCKEVARLIEQSAKSEDAPAKDGASEDSAAASKRKAGELDEGAPEPQKAKNKKVKKAKAS